MIKPETLYNFGKVCKDSLMAGNVLRALCRQTVELNPAEQTVYEMIQNDNGWMEERIEDRKVKERERKAKFRMSHNVPGTTRDNAGQDACPTMSPGQSVEDACPAPTKPSQAKPSQAKPSQAKPDNNITRSVPVRAGARTREGDPERNGNGTGDLTQEGFALAKRMAKAFADAVKDDDGAFFDPDQNPVAICTALTGDYKSLSRWAQLVREKGEAAVRDEAFRFWRELRAGETVDNRGAALNTRLAKLEDAK